MRENQTQLFKTNYETRCDTFGCGESAAYMVGRPDSPLNTCHVLCATCTDTLVESVKTLFDMHEKSVHSPNNDEEEATHYELEEVLENIKTHAQLDDLIDEFQVKGIPNRGEEGGKIHERKDAVREAFGK